SLGDLLALPQGEVAFGLIAPDGAQPAAVLIVDVGDQIANARKVLEKGAAAIENAGGVKSTETAGDTSITVYVVGGDANRTLAHLLLESPRGGILKMIALKAGETTPESWVPADAASYITFHWDAQETYSELTKIYNSFAGDNALAGLAKTNVSDRIGADLETE